jgi:hypothetical protein
LKDSWTNAYELGQAKSFEIFGLTNWIHKKNLLKTGLRIESTIQVVWKQVGFINHDSKQNESMDSQYKSMCTQFPDTIPATLKWTKNGTVVYWHQYRHWLIPNFRSSNISGLQKRQIWKPNLKKLFDFLPEPVAGAKNGNEISFNEGFNKSFPPFKFDNRCWTSQKILWRIPNIIKIKSFREKKKRKI